MAETKGVECLRCYSVLVVGVPVEINGYILVPSSSIADVEEDYEYIKNFRRKR